MQKKQPFIDISENRLDVCEGRSLWMVGIHFRKRIKHSVQNLGRGPWTWWPLKLTLHYLQSCVKDKISQSQVGYAAQCHWVCLTFFFLFFFSPLKCESCFTISGWCWSNLKTTLYLCMCFRIQGSPPSPKASCDTKTFKMLLFLPASG